MKIRRFLFSALCLPAVFSSCEKEEKTWQDIPNTQISPVSKGNKVIYEAQVSSYSNNGRGTFKGIEEDLPRLDDLGIDILWLMPVHPIGEQNRNGELGSPYGVKDYMDVNPEYGTKEDFKSLVDACHRYGIEVWMDWVANHTSWDNVWVKDHLDWYAEKDGRRPYSPPGWDDAIQLDHSNVQMRDAMADAMKYWVREFDIDGFRCDAADRVPVAFWRELRRQVDAVKKVTWLSEGWAEDHLEVFDYDYAWSFSESLDKFGEDGNVSRLIEACKSLHRDAAYKDRGRMVYLTNHDLSAFNGTEFKRYGNNVLPLTVLSFTVFDMPLIYSGQEIGMNKELWFSEVCPVEWEPVNKQYLALFRKLTALKRTQPALEDGAGRGSLKIYPTKDSNVFAYSRVRGANEVLVILNLGNYAARCRFTGEIPEGRFKDWLNNGYMEFDASGIPLRENGYAVYVK